MSKINEEDIDLTRSLIHRSEVNLNCVDSDISGTGGNCFYEVNAVDTTVSPAGLEVPPTRAQVV